MAEPFLSEIRIMAFNYPPKSWAQCNGQIMPINQNQALFSLLGTTYGGDGRSTFGLPNMIGRAPVHTGNGFSLGQAGGEAAHTLSLSELPTHTHSLSAATANGTGILPSANLLAGGTPQIYHAVDQNLTPLNAASVTNVGGSQPHQNLQPFLVLNFCIALQGVFPSQS